MDNSFFAYLQQLEAMAFFSGYPLIFTLAFFISGNLPENHLKRRIVLSLPLAYALTATLYLGLQLKNLFPDYSAGHIRMTMPLLWLVGWGLLAVLFWLPGPGRKPIVSLVHSLVFFFFLIRDLMQSVLGLSPDRSLVKNDMKVYTISLLLNLGTLALIILFSWLVSRRHGLRPVANSNDPM